tara:strand:+ start:112 stop:1122 length:1011 start_codon:yes stop_codon:yes gene_type:complete
MNETNLNICQVSLKRDIPLIKENFKNFKKIYKSNVKFFIVCPKKQMKDFSKRLNYNEIKIINEDELISFKTFNEIFRKLSKNIIYQKKFSKRLNWYYQQILKISFILKFITKNNQDIIVWDADTIILKKINFFSKKHSINYGNFFEFNKNYYLTNKGILKRLPNYYISFLNQFISVTKKECRYLITNLLNEKKVRGKFTEKLSILILSKIFKIHKDYDGSLFSEYELIGQSNYLLNHRMQKPILFLRLNLDGKLTKFQKKISKFLNYKHVTYEHKHVGKKNHGMLKRTQSYSGFLKIIFKDFLFYHVKSLFHFFNSYYSNDFTNNQLYKVKNNKKD